MHGEKLSSSSARGVVSSVVLKHSDIMSPTSPCCKQGLISAFIATTNTKDQACKPTEVLQVCVLPSIFLCLHCLCVRLCVCLCACLCLCASFSSCVAQLFNIYLVHVEKTNLRVTGGLMQSSNRIQHVSFSHHLLPTVAG